MRQVCTIAKASAARDGYSSFYRLARAWHGDKIVAQLPSKQLNSLENNAK
jgi:hypothetical protein